MRLAGQFVRWVEDEDGRWRTGVPARHAQESAGRARTPVLHKLRAYSPIQAP
jgi:hypothetical protein